MFPLLHLLIILAKIFHKYIFVIFSILDILPISIDAKSETITKTFLHQVFEILLDFICKSNDRESKVLDFHHPEQIMQVMDFSLPDHPQNLDQILVDCKDALKYQVKTGDIKSCTYIQMKKSKTKIFGIL